MNEANNMLWEASSKEESKSRGKLKVFFGYAAGVGKTYAMLEAAHIAQNSGIDVVAGYIEPHERPETGMLIKGLEVIPPIYVSWNGVTVREFDIDKAIKRHPSLILVDELAHTNAKGSRNLKRYQDIDELLKAGIDVYTTVNVQHIESLHDMVYQITKIAVNERIPDKIIDEADKIELVDIEPDELIARLESGYVYKDEQVKRALENFFTKENLVALREIALRRTADQITNRAEHEYSFSKRDYYTGEHILICLSSSPSNAKVIRTAARMASVFHASFTALFVETSYTSELSEKNKIRLRGNFKLAEQLGAKITTVYGENVPEQIAEYAKVAGISKIVIGRSGNRKKLFSKPNFVDKLTQLAPNLDIYIIPDNIKPYSPPKKHLKNIIPVINLKDCFLLFFILVISTLVGFGFFNLGFNESNIITVYILGVLVTAVCTNGKLYSAASSLLSVFVFNYFFTEPRYTLNAYDAGYPVTFIIMFGSAFLTSTLTMRVKEQSRQNALKARRTEVLLETSQKLQKAPDKEHIYTVMGQQIVKLLEKTTLIYPVFGKSTLMEPIVFHDGNDENKIQDEYLSENERTVAKWVLTNNKSAGATTNTLASAKCFYLAVRGQAFVYAVVAIAMDDEIIDQYEKNILISMLGEFGLALEKEAINEANKEVYLKAQQEQLRANLMRAISHDLRTPLTSISGNASILMGNESVLDKNKRVQLYTDIYDDSMWLIGLVENLLCLTRIDNSQMKINMQPEIIDEIITEALKHINRKSVEYSISADVSDELLMANVDARLIMQVIINLVDNAIKYTKPGTSIAVKSYKAECNKIAVDISDNGLGIPDKDKERIFEMFYTTNKDSWDNRRGLGLGLALCKSIISAHGGEITVKDNTPSGTIFTFTLVEKEVITNE